MQAIALIVHVALAIGVIGLVLIQHGKGADAGAAFGSGASSTVFGARGSASFLTRMTTGLAAAFFATSLILFYMAAHRDGGISSVTDSIPSVIKEEAEQQATESDMPASSSGSDSSTDTPAATSTESDLPSTESSTESSESN